MSQINIASSMSNRKRLISRSIGGCLLLALALCTGHLSCGNPDTTLVSVRLTGSTPDVDAVQVTFSLNGTADPRSPYQFSKNTTFFGIQLYAPDNVGTLNVGVELLGKQCIISSGQNQVKLEGKDVYELEIQIVPKTTKSCLVTVMKYGDGTVTSQPPGILCGSSCTGYFDNDKPVRLDAMPGIPGTPFIWGGDCGTKTNCQVTPSVATTIGIDFTPRVCRPSDFCWEFPRPLASDLRSVWASSTPTAFIVGDFGTILRSTPAGWASMDSGTQDSLYGVWGVDDNDIWAVGQNGTALHWSSNTWTRTNTTITQPLRAVWGAAANAVWAIGDQGTVLRWDGATWAAEVTPVAGQTVYLNSIWGSGPKDIWVAGSDGVLLHYDGTAWAQGGSNTMNRLRSVWGTGPADAWIVGDMGTVRRWNGTNWQPQPTVNGGLTRLDAVWGAGVNTVWAVGTEPNSQGQYEGVVYAWTGSGWSKLPDLTTSGWFNINGKAPSRGWLVGGNGAIGQYDGKAWSVSNPATVKEFRAVWMTAKDDGWAVGARGQIYRWNSLTWEAQTPVTTQDLKAVWASGRDDVWAVGNQGTVLHYNGAAWASVMTGTTAILLNGVAGNGPNDVWIAGDEVLRWDGNQWNKMPSPPRSLGSIFVEKGTVYGTASTGIYSFDGTTWKQASGEYVAMIAGTGMDLYAAGAKGIYQLSGGNWTLAYPSTTQAYGIYYRSNQDIWAVGEQGRILHWDGSSWSAVDNNVAYALYGVGGFGDRDIWVVGDNGAILHRR